MRRRWLLKEINGFAQASLMPSKFRHNLSNPTIEQLAGEARSQGKGKERQTKGKGKEGQGKGKGKARGKSKDPSPKSKLREIPSMPGCASFLQDMAKAGDASREEGSDLQLKWLGA